MKNNFLKIPKPMKTLRYSIFLLFLFVFGFASSALYGQQKLSDELLSEFEYRNMAPHRVGSWISDIAVPETDDPNYEYTFYVSGRHGGVWKTENNGVTFEPIFEDHGTTSIGAIGLAPSNPEIVWVGTGEASNARSTHAGNGIYKSVDGGETFQYMGLKDSHHIARVVSHPEDEDIVYVAAVGHLFSTNETRGVFKTTDGGETWEKVLYINNNTGVIDLAINRQNPEIVYAATYDKQRYPWHLEAGGSESGIYKTTDAGNNWERLSGGFPDGKIGRIGIDIYRQNPDILYAVVENLNPKEDNPDELKYGEVYRTDDAGVSWTKTNHDSVDVSGKAAYSFNQIMIDPNDERNVFINSVYVQTSHDRGQTWHDVEGSPSHLFTNMFGDIRTMWIDPDDSRHLIIGSDGGVYTTYDGGENMQHLYHIPLGEAYDVEVDDTKPYHVYVGLQDHEGWKAPSNSFNGAIGTPHWDIVGMWDGMYHKVDHNNNRWLYFTTQFGSHHRVDQLKGERVNIEPEPPEGKEYRYTWNTPLEISPHNSKIIYTGGQMLLRSIDQGETWEEISPDLTTNDKEKIAGEGHVMYCTITTISESPLTAGTIWVGTDDGKVHVTRDHGKEWTEVTSALEKAGAPEEYWISRVFASNHQPGVAYVTVTGFRQDDFRPFVFKTENYGETWKDISSNLPNQPVNILVEDEDNPDLLYLANDHGVYISINGGDHWVNMNNNMPPVPVKDLVVQNREGDLVAGTYGRGVYITDIYPLKELTPEILDKNTHLFDIEPEPPTNYSQQRFWGNYRLMGDSQIYTPNESNGLKIYYYLKNDLQQEPRIIIKKGEDKVVEELSGTGQEGLHKVVWDTREASPGNYSIILKAGGNEITKTGVVEEKITWTVGNKDKIKR
jgi:photosystem II stability/assembly factor-like uncharacterized protein